ncbi:MAG TPA: Spy/CpxP family protein refolding chaperone [Gemmatimonadota bacterium]|nr:Spy/CpxP family protein refolding chaperone [Gemmatimonadota bacterium]
MNERRGPSPVLAAGLLLVVAAIGVLGGIALDRTVLRHHGPPGGWIGRHGPHGPPNREFRGHVRDRIAEHLGDELELSAGQREELSAVLERQEARLAEAMAETRPRLHQILEDTHREILAILTPEQRERFEESWMTRRGRHPILWHEPADTAEEVPD